MSNRTAARCAAGRWPLAACRAQPTEPHFPAGPARCRADRRRHAFRPRMRATALGEAEEVMALAGVKPGCRSPTLARARAIIPSAWRPCRAEGAGAGRRHHARRARYAQRPGPARNLDNVAVKLGTPDNPMLPPQSFDRVFLVHMYHEVQSPYAFLWHLRDGVKPDGLVVVVDSDRPVKQPRHAAGAAEMRVRGARTCSRSSSAC